MFNTLLKKIEIEYKNGLVTISGLNGNTLVKDFVAKWKTKRIPNYMFFEKNFWKVSFKEFFLLDVIYTFEELLQLKYLKTSRRALQTTISELKSFDFFKSIFDKTIKVQDRLDFSILKKLLKIDLYEHQMEYLEKYNEIVPRYRLNGHLAHVGVGGGKTILGLSLMACAKKDIVIYVVPMNSVVNAWESDINVIFKNPEKYWHSLSSKPFDVTAKHFIIHYEAIEKYLPFFLTNGFDKKNVGIVIDECHNFNDIKSKRTTLFVEMCKKLNAKDILWMSGTPLKASGLEVIPLLKTIDPLFTKDVEKDYYAIYCSAKSKALTILSNRIGYLYYRINKDQIMKAKGQLGIKINFYTAKVKLPNGKDFTLSNIKTKMQKFVEERYEYYKNNEKKYNDDYNEAIDFYRNLILKDAKALNRLSEYERDVKIIKNNYDPKIHKELSFNLNKFEKTVIAPKLPSELRKRFYKAKSVVKYVKLTILGEALGSVLGKMRTECNVELSKNLNDLTLIPKNNESPERLETSLSDIINNSEKKTILFTNFVEVVKSTSVVLESMDFKPLLVYGDTNKNLTSIINSFTNDPDANPLIATFQSLSTAVRLTSANTIVMLNNPFREHEYSQAYGRAYRLGQDKDVNVIDILLDTGNEPNISTRSKEILEDAAEAVSIMLGTNNIDVDISLETLIEDNTLNNDVHYLTKKSKLFPSW